MRRSVARRGTSGRERADLPGDARERIFAACAPGLERFLADELSALGLRTHPVAGGAEAEGPDAVARTCLASRLSDAVKLRVWDGPGRNLEAARRAAAPRFPGQALEIRRAGSQAALSVDAVGAPLFKRGWRSRIGAAPIRETIAAGLLRALGYDGSVPFLDPMCGAATMAIEAALVAARRAPGLDRSFAFERWPGQDARRTARLRASLAAEARDPPAAIVASDRNGGAVRLARKNVETAGLSAVVTVERRDAAEIVPPAGAGVCLVNPPYGLRLDDAEEAWDALARLVPRLGGWTLGVLASSRRLADRLPCRPVATLEVRNGGIRCAFLTFRP
ncbi:MAG TPA: RNA methyltransferase [Anaeromyxobacteraceae bacterium]|nr:RNA methyltransferase [Anaeromyxobacteraceae bacterium]